MKVWTVGSCLGLLLTAGYLARFLVHLHHVPNPFEELVSRYVWMRFAPPVLQSKQAAILARTAARNVDAGTTVGKRPSVYSAVLSGNNKSVHQSTKVYAERFLRYAST